MLRATTSYKGLWLSPSFVIHRMRKIIETHGIPEANSSRRFKQEREAWTTAVWALGLTEMHKRNYWIEIETEDSTPDTKVHRLDQSSGHNKIETYNVEVVDWESHVDDVMQVIRQKCERAYPSYFWLLILGRNGKTLDLDSTIEVVRELRVPFAEIWIIGRPEEAMQKRQMVRLYPEKWDLIFDLARALKESEKQTEIMRPGKRGTGTDAYPLGSSYLPIP
jgi:hypothetical protein